MRNFVRQSRTDPLSSLLSDFRTSQHRYFLRTLVKKVVLPPHYGPRVKRALEGAQKTKKKKRQKRGTKRRIIRRGARGSSLSLSRTPSYTGMQIPFARPGTGTGSWPLYWQAANKPPLGGWLVSLSRLRELHGLSRTREGPTSEARDRCREISARLLSSGERERYLARARTWRERERERATRDILARALFIHARAAYTHTHERLAVISRAAAAAACPSLAFWYISRACLFCVMYFPFAMGGEETCLRDARASSFFRG